MGADDHDEAAEGPTKAGPEASSTVDEEALKWRKEYSVKAVGSRNRCVTTTEDGYEICSDIPRSMGGGDTAPQPVQLLLAALAGCETATAHFVARRIKMRLQGLTFDLVAWRDQRGAIGLPIPSEEGSEPAVPARLQEVRGMVTVDAEGASEAQLAVLRHEVHIRCPVANMMEAAGCRLDRIQWVLKE